MVKTQCTELKFFSIQVILLNLSERIFSEVEKCPKNLWPTLQVNLILFIISKDDDSCEAIARCHSTINRTVFKFLSPSNLSQTLHRWCSVAVPQCYMLLYLCYVRCSLDVFIFKSSVCPIHLFQEWSQSCHLFGKEQLAGLSSVILLFITICLSVFAFDVWYGLWNLPRKRNI